MKCIICGTNLTAWPGGAGYGNNPAPWPSQQAATILKDNEAYRCCDHCNQKVVIPIRIASWMVR